MPSIGKLQELTRVITSNRLPKRPKDQIKPPPVRVRPLSSPEPSKLRAVSVESKKQQQQQKQLKVSRQMGENSNSDLLEQERRIPLADVVADCAKRWFQDTLREAKAGDSAMQVLVAQMYKSGYGVPVNDQKAEAWMLKASRTVHSVWKVTDKRPGYHASDSDSEDAKGSNK